MTSCNILNNETVTELLTSLTRDDVREFLRLIGSTLADFSVGQERQYQPEPSVIKRPDGRKTLFRLFTSSTGVGTKIIVDPAAALAAEQEQLSTEEFNKLKGLHGILVICDQNGFPRGLINAEEITGFRTTLSALLLYVKREDTTNIVVFGAGKQALWHIRLALTLRGDDIRRITIINRSVDRARSLLDEMRRENDTRWKVSVDWHVVEEGDMNGLQSALAEANVIFCTTPSKEPLFPAEYLHRETDGCYISAIGSWSADMIEIPTETMQHAAQRQKNGTSLIVADDVKECMNNAGEFVKSGLKADEVMEAGEVVKLLDGPANVEHESMHETLKNGFVIYKSVGVSMTDLAAGQALLDLAQRKNRGVVMSAF